MKPRIDKQSHTPLDTSHGCLVLGAVGAPQCDSGMDCTVRLSGATLQVALYFAHCIACQYDKTPSMCNLGDPQ